MPSQISPNTQNFARKISNLKSPEYVTFAFKMAAVDVERAKVGAILQVVKVFLQISEMFFLANACFGNVRFD